MSVVSISIRYGATVILPWTIIEGYSDGCTFLDLFEGVKSEKFDLGSWTFPEKLRNAQVSVSIGKTKTDCDPAIITNKVAVTIPVFGHYIRYSLSDSTCNSCTDTCSAVSSSDDQTSNSVIDDPDKGNTTRRNLNDVLLMGARKLTLPEPYAEDCKIVNNKRVVYNKILYMLGNAGLGFTPMTMNEGKNFINALTNCIWTIDPHLETLQDRSFVVPILFENLFGYNNPENHKHKRGELSQSTLMSLTSHLDACLEQPWICKLMWVPIKTAAQTLSDSMHKYVEYLKQQADKMNQNRQLMFPVRSLDETKSVTIIRPCYIVKPGAASRYKLLVNCVEKLEMFKPVCVDEYTPQNTRDRRYFLDNMKHGLPYKCVHLKFSAGNNLGSHNFLWRIPASVSDTDNDLIQKNTDVIQSLNKDLPSYHTRAMRRAFIYKASLLCNLKASNARYIYKSLAGDCSLPENVTEKEVDLRVQQAFEMEDPDIITDLRQHNTGQPSKYQIFFTYAKQYLENVIETAVDDRRHDCFTHLAQAMSVPDLLQQVKDLCPENTPIPSEQWLRLQFAPKNPSSLASLQYTGNLKVKFQVQSRQLRKTHVDNHYASAIFRYLKDFAVKFRNFCMFVAMDDKHHCKVGEPGHPVAAVERGKRVVVGSDKVFAVSDHDFTKFSIVPSVTMLIDIPESVAEGSFYRGQVYVGVKDLALEPSSPLRHITELKDILIGEGLDRPILCMYTDGGPDHRVTYLSIQLSIICLFLSGNYDMIIAARTPPMASWKNPPERIMSILNLALQAVGLMRKETSDVCEQKLKSANGLSQLRDIAKDPLICQEMVDSIEPVKTLLSQLFRRLKLKEKQFKLFNAASEANLNELWGELSKFGNPPDGKRQQDIKKSLKDCPKLVEFMEHCCVSRTYFFTVKKCGASDCQICGPPRLPVDVFSQLHDFPDPVPEDEGHYKEFSEVFGTETTEEYCPSLSAKQRATLANKHGIPFSPSAQTAKTVKQTVTCIDCEKPRVIYSATKLSGHENAILTKILGLYQYSCGSELQELKPEDSERAPRISALLEKVFIRSNLSCATPVEVPYYSSGVFPPVCYHCGAQNTDTEEGQYPMCHDCVASKLQPPLKRKNVQTMRADRQKKQKK